MTRLCPCGRPSANYVCRACTTDAQVLLVRARDLAHDLVVTIARQDRIAAPAPSGKGHARPLPFNVAASEAHELLRSTLRSWRAELAATDPTPPPPADAIGALVDDLLRRLPSLPGRPDAPVFLDELRHAVDVAHRTVDLYVHRLYIGVCDPYTCPADLYATADEQWVVCDRCGATHDALQRRQVILAAGADRDLTVDALVRLAGAYGLATTRNAVNGHVRRGDLVARGANADGRAVYRVGDLLDVLAARRTTTRPTRKATA